MPDADPALRAVPATEHDYAHRVLAVFAFDHTDGLWWRVDAQYAPVTFFATCNDFFAWGGSDVEPITPQDVPLLEQAADDVDTVAGGGGWAGELFAARKRGMRPQGAAYADIPQGLWPLFDACGPPRTVGLGNPRPRPEDPAPGTAP